MIENREEGRDRHPSGGVPWHHLAFLAHLPAGPFRGEASSGRKQGWALAFCSFILGDGLPNCLAQLLPRQGMHFKNSSDPSLGLASFPMATQEQEQRLCENSWQEASAQNSR